MFIFQYCFHNHGHTVVDFSIFIYFKAMTIFTLIFQKVNSNPCPSGRVFFNFLIKFMATLTWILQNIFIVWPIKALIFLVLQIYGPLDVDFSKYTWIFKNILKARGPFLIFQFHGYVDLSKYFKSHDPLDLDFSIFFTTIDNYKWMFSCFQIHGHLDVDS